MKCTKCGAVIEEGMKFCPVCGEAVVQEEPKQESVSYCPKCGKPYTGTPSFCPSCGNSLFVQNVENKAQDLGNNIGRQAQDLGNNINQSFQNANFGQYFPQAQPGFVPERNIALYLILTIITCGLFGLYWLVCLVNDLNTAAGTPTDTNGITVLLLTIVTCGIYGLYWMFKAGEKVSIIKRNRGIPDSGNNGILYLVLQLIGLGIINYCLIQNEINQVATGR